MEKNSTRDGVFPGPIGAARPHNAPMGYTTRMYSLRAEPFERFRSFPEAVSEDEFRAILERVPAQGRAVYDKQVPRRKGERLLRSGQNARLVRELVELECVDEQSQDSHHLSALPGGTFDDNGVAKLLDETSSKTWKAFRHDILGTRKGDP